MLQRYMSASVLTVSNPWRVNATKQRYLPTSVDLLTVSNPWRMNATKPRSSPVSVLFPTSGLEHSRSGGGRGVFSSSFSLCVAWQSPDAGATGHSGCVGGGGGGGGSRFRQGGATAIPGVECVGGGGEGTAFLVRLERPAIPGLATWRGGGGGGGVEGEWGGFPGEGGGRGVFSSPS